MKSNLFRNVICVALLLALPLSTVAQRLQQKMARGVVAVNRTGGRSVTSSGGQGNLISWRKLLKSRKERPIMSIAARQAAQATQR